MAFEQKDNTGALFRNDKKEKDSHPDYKGSALIDGVDMWIAAWVKEGKNGKFFSMSFTPKEDQKPSAKSSSIEDMEDDLPF